MTESVPSPLGLGFDVGRKTVVSAGVGALVAAVVSVGFRFALAERSNSCNESTQICFNTSPFVVIVVGLIIVVIVCAVGFALAGLRPVSGFVLSGVALSTVVSFASTTHVRGQQPHLIQGFAVVMAACFVLLALVGELREESSLRQLLRR